MKTVLTRVEGEGSAVIVEREGYVDSVIYEVSEAPRFFEYLVIGKSPERVVDIVSRICGICGTSYNFVASTAFEKCFSVDVDYEVATLREALHLAERVKSHILHLFYLNLPDLVGTASFEGFLQRNPELARDAVAVLAWSRKVMEVLGGRMHNVVNMKIGGVHKVPDKSDVERVAKELGSVMKSFLEFASFTLCLRDSGESAWKTDVRVHQASLYTPTYEYPHHGDKVLMDGDVYSLSEFYGNTVKYQQVPYSTAIHCRIKGVESYVVGPIARFNHFYSSLHKEVRDFLRAHGWEAPLGSVKQSYVARIAETFDALLTLERFFDAFRGIAVPCTATPAKGEYVCEYAVEAPRGILYHKYVVRDGKIIACDIIAPTTQNLAAMNDIATATLRGRRVDPNAVAIVKKIAVAFDPCLSCSVHALPVKIIKADDNIVGLF
jgi:coenzyme F420-reducing hydrogenase alpha subunit